MKKRDTGISAIILAKNEEERIGDCLKSLSFADETLVVDTGSTDRTVEIAGKLGAEVITYTKSRDFSKRRMKGSKGAKGEWLLYVDADERVTPLLQKEIKSSVNKPGKYSAFAIPRKNILLGHEMRYGGWWPDYVLRLIKKDALKGYVGELHEQPEIKGKIGKLTNPLTHITHRSLTEMVKKTNDWSEIEARLMFKANHPQMNIPRFFTAMFREFWYRAVKEKGFLDGPVGVIEIIYQVFSRFISYAKLWEMQITSQ